MQSKNVLSLSLLLAIVMAATIRACPTPSCKRTTNCELFDHLSNTSRSAPADIITTVTLGDIVNPAFTTDIPGFLDFIFNRLDYGLDKVGNFTQDCLLDNPPEEQCKYKIITVSRSHNMTCDFEYNCDYNRNRIPQYIWKANCLPAATGMRSVPVYYKVPVLEMRDNEGDCDPFAAGASMRGWTWRQLEVPVACTCMDTNSA